MQLKQFQLINIAVLDEIDDKMNILSRRKEFRWRQPESFFKQMELFEEKQELRIHHLEGHKVHKEKKEREKRQRQM